MDTGRIAPEGVTLGGDACDQNNDNNGCDNAVELGPDHKLGGQRDPLNPWDFADMWVPSLPASGTATGGRNGAISISDVIAVLPWIGAVLNGGANTNGRVYNNDSNSNGVKDGGEYDRTPSSDTSKPWQSGPPNGAVTIQDALVVLASVGDKCL